MRDRYTMRELTAALGVDGNTARRWLEQLGIEPQAGKRDARERYVSAEDAQRVAAAHEVTLLDLPDDMPATLPDAWRRIAELTTELSRLKRELASKTYSAPYQPPASLPTRAYAPAPRGPSVSHTSSSVPPLPEGWYPLATFATIHGIPVTTVKKAEADGRIQCEHGEWLYARNIVRLALTPEQQEVFLRVYPSRRDPFQPREQDELDSAE